MTFFRLKRFLTISTLLLCVLTSQTLANVTYFTNANGYTLRTNTEDKYALVRFSEMLIKDDKVVGIGNGLNAPEGAQVIDVKQRTILPGIIDAHGHLLGLGENLTQANLREASSEMDAVKLVKDFIGSVSIGDGWIIGRGWNQENWHNKQFPSKDSLDKAFPNQAVWLTRVDGHAAWANSKALKIAGITELTVSPEGGDIIHGKDGKPTGILIDNAMALVEHFIPKLDNKQLHLQLNTAFDHLLSLGITSMHDAGISEQVRDFYVEQSTDKALRVRIYAMLAATDPALDKMLSEGYISDKQDFLSIRSVKAYGDGALGSRGAALLAPYKDAPENSGLLVTKQAQLPGLFEQVISQDFQLNFHAIGDRANRLALIHFGEAFKQYPGNPMRHRIEHAQVIALDDIPKLKSLNVIPSMQPTHATSDKNMAEDRLGKQRLKGAYAWRTLLDQGSRIAFGSDFPVEKANPFHGLHAAVTRQDANNDPEGGWIPEESVSITEAFAGFTIDAAYAAFQEDILGTLDTNKKADFIIVDRDIFTVPAAEIRDTRVLQTWVNGKLAYSFEE